MSEEQQNSSNEENANNSANDENGQNAEPIHKGGASAFLGDLTDGREKGDWKSRYVDEEAQKAIKYEKNYLFVIITLNIAISILIGILLAYVLPEGTCKIFRKYIFAFLGGVMGGTVFSIKWLIHSVAKNTWNRDRRLWRLFTPIVSGVLGFVVILLLSTKILAISNLNSADIHKCYGIAFLIGYFSDNAIGKLTEIAQVFFGSSNGRK